MSVHKKYFNLLFSIKKHIACCFIRPKGVTLHNYLNNMKKYILSFLLAGTFLVSCGEYNKVLKSSDYEYKYEAAKSYFGKGSYIKSATILEELIPILKGTDHAEESLYMLAMSYYNQGDYVTAPIISRHITPNILTELTLSWPVSIQENPCSWILRKLVWIRQVPMPPSLNFSCSWSISRKASATRMPKS